MNLILEYLTEVTSWIVRSPGGLARTLSLDAGVNLCPLLDRIRFASASQVNRNKETVQKVLLVEGIGVLGEVEQRVKRV